MLSARPDGSMMMSTTSLELKESRVSQITARLPDTVVEALDAAAEALHRSRAEIIRQAVERYLEDFDDLSVVAGAPARSRRPGAGLGQQ